MAEPIHIDIKFYCTKISVSEVNMTSYSAPLNSSHSIIHIDIYIFGMRRHSVSLKKYFC